MFVLCENCEMGCLWESIWYIFLFHSLLPKKITIFIKPFEFFVLIGCDKEFPQFDEGFTGPRLCNCGNAVKNHISVCCHWKVFPKYIMIRMEADCQLVYMN